MKPSRLTRRDFLKISSLGLGALALLPCSRQVLPWEQRMPQVEFPAYERLGRVCRGMVEIKARPDLDSQSVGVLYEDAVKPWLREVSGTAPNLNFNTQRWVETPEGYVYGQLFQPVRNQPNSPVASLPGSSLGKGMWAEVTVPYVDATLENQPSSNSWVAARLDEGLPVRFYYSQVFWIDRLKTGDNGQVYYRVNPNFYGGVDMLWAAAEAFRPITAEDLTPIHPEAGDKRIEVDLDYQVLSCYEGKDEVYYCRISSGAKYNMLGETVDKWATPVGQHKISRKFITLQMSGGTTGAGYDLPGIGWTMIFATGGVAIHSTFWHNSYGDRLSHGCVNVGPEDACWIFRWTAPQVPADPGMVDITLTGDASTPVEVFER